MQLQKISASILLCFMLVASTCLANESSHRWTWNYKNGGSVQPSSPIGQDTTISAPPETDIWRPASDKDNFTAPFLYTTIASQEFKRMRVSVKAPWKTQFDQGGLVVTFPDQEGPLRWIKAGIEFFEGQSNLGVVATDRFSDWSLSPILETASGHVGTTIEIERDGTGAWVYVLEKGGRRALRQVTWAFNDGASKNLHIGVYAAKPTHESEPGHENDSIEVTFSGFEIETVNNVDPNR